MANRKPDIELLHGVLGGGKISGESAQLIKSQLEQIANELNANKYVEGRGIRFGLAEKETRKGFAQSLERIASSLYTDNKFKIQISHIDAKSAIDRVKDELNAMLRTIKIDTGFEVSIGSDGLSSATKKVQGDAAKATLSLNEIEAKLKELGITSKSITKTYEQMWNALGGDNAVGDNRKALDEMRAAFVAFETARNNLDSKKAFATEDTVQEVYSLGAIVQEQFKKIADSMNLQTVPILPDVEARIKELEVPAKHITKVYGQMWEALGGDNAEGENQAALDRLKQDYIELMNLMDRVKGNPIGASENDFRDIYNLSASIQEQFKGIRDSMAQANAPVAPILEDIDAQLKMIDVSAKGADTVFKNLSATLSQNSQWDGAAEQLKSLKDAYVALIDAINKAKADPSAVTADMVKGIEDAFDKFNRTKTDSEHLVTVNTSDAEARLRVLTLASKDAEAGLKKVRKALEKNPKAESSIGDITALEAAYERLAAAIRKISADPKKATTAMYDEANAARTAFVNEATRMTSLIDGLEHGQERLNGVAKSVKDYEAILSAAKNNLGSKMELFGAADIEEYEEILKRLTAQLEDAESISVTAEPEKYLQKLESIKAEMAIIDPMYQKAKIANDTLKRENSLRTQAINLLKQYNKFMDENPAARGTTQFADLEQHADDLRELIKSAEKLDATSLGQFRSELAQIGVELQDADRLGESFGDTLKRQIKDIVQLLGPASIIDELVDQVREMVNVVKEIDAAMTELKKVTDESEITYAEYLDDAVVRAKELGASVADTVNASADFARLGYSLKDAASLADSALVYKNVGDGITDVTAASESIISTMRAFKVEAENAMFIVDKFNEVGNNFAISSKGIGDALLRSASALASGNNTLDESIGLITAANSVVQDADKVGTTLKTVSMYLRAAKTEAEEAGESTDGMADSVSELRGELLELTGGKVDIQLDEDTFKSTYQIIKELSQVWGELTDISQANILEMIGGKRNSNVVASMLTNFDVAENVVKTAAEASGSALAENAKQLESINGKLTKMKAAFDALALSVVNDDFTKGIIDGITALLELLHDLIEAFGGVGNTLLVVGNIAAGLKFKDFSEYIQKAVNAFKVWNGTLIDVTGGASQAGKAMGNMGEAAAKAAEHTSGAATAMSKAGDGAIAVSRGVKAASVSIMAVTAVISIAISAYQAWKRNIEEQAEAAAESAREYRESANSLEAYQKQITELNDKLKYSNLSQEEAYEVRKNLLSIQDEIRDAYGKEAEAIDLVRMSADEANESIDALKKTQAEEHLLKNGTAISRSIRKIETEKDWLNATLGVGNASEAEIASLEEALKQYENVFFDRRKVGKNAFFDIRVNANVIEAKEVIQSLSADLDSLQESAGNISLAGLELALPAAYEKIESLFDTHYEAYEGAILPKIVDNSEYDRVYNLITDAQDAFANLQTAGYDDAERRVDSAKALLDTVTTVAAELEKVPFKAEDNAVRNYLFELLEGLQKDLDREALYVDLVVGAPEGDRKKRFAQKQIQNALDVFRREDGQVYEVDIQNVGLTASAPAEAMDSGNYDVAGELSEQEVAWISLRNAAAEYNLEVEDLISLLITKGDVMQEITQTVQEQTASIDGLSESITNLKGTYDLLATAQEEMASEKGGLSAETIQAVMEAEKNYLDYLYEENGVIKLNTDAWRVRGEAAADIDTTGLYDEIDALEKRNAVLLETIAWQQRVMGETPESSDDYARMANELDVMTKELHSNNEAIDEKIRKLKLYAGVMATIKPTEWDSTKFTFDANVSKLQAVGTLQKELANGYTITAQKARELADAYPEILAQAQVSTDGQITLNQGVVSAFISGKTEEVNTAIDGEMSKLEAKRSLLEAELAIVRKQIAVAQGGDQAAVDSANQAAGTEIGIMQTVLAAAEQAGIDEATANQLALQAMSGDWGTFADTAIAALGGLDTESAGIFTSVMQNFAKTSQNMIHNSNQMILAFNRLGTAFRASMNPDGETVSTYLANVKTGSAKASYEESVGKLKEEMQALFESSKSIWVSEAGAGKGDIRSEAEKNTQPIKDLIEQYSKDYAESSEDLKNLFEREASLISQIDAINGQIAILESLKLTSPKKLLESDSGSGGSSSSKEIEEYVVDIDKYREALERLARVRLSKEELELQLSNTEDLKKRIELQKQLIDVYKSEQDAIKELVELRRDTIAQDVSSLQDMGFKIDYDRESDKFFIRNLELINTLVAENRGEYETMQEATNALREETEALITSLEGLNEENQKSITEWRELGYVVEDTKTNVINDLKQMVTQASDALDTIQNVYDTLKKAADEYAENDGFISLDTYQALIELGPQYMQFLRDENGLLVINEQNIQRVIAARAEQLALESAMAYVEQIKLALQEDSIAKLNNLLYATQEATNATWGLVYAELDLLRITGELTGGQYEAAIHNIDAIRSLANSAMAGIGQVAGAAQEEASKLADELNDMKSGVDDIIKYVMDMLKHRVEQQIDALERMKEAYADIIELKKESLDASKEETDYQDEVAAKVKEIAKLQEKINLLQLDDSRDARAEEAKLAEEMAKLQKELADVQADYALEAQKESLDKMQEAYEEQKDAEIEALEQTISSEQKLYDAALSYISNNFDTLYQELIAWNTEYGSSLNSEITTAWDNAIAAVQRYGSILNAIDLLPGDIEAAQNAANSSNTNAGSNVVVGETNQDHSYSTDDMIVALIKQMIANSAAWHTSSNKADLERRNQDIGYRQLPALGVDVEYDSHTGQWTMKNTGELLYDWAKRVYAGLFHSGGIVGEIGSVKDNERLAKLENGEVVITKKARESLFSLIDFFSDATKQMKLTGGYFSRDILPKAETPNLSNITNNQSEAIHFGDVHIYGANEQTVEKHKAVNREFANEVLRHLKARR